MTVSIVGEAPGSVPERAAAEQSLWEFVRTSGLRSLVVGTSKDPNAKVTILLVSPESGRPVFAVKAPTTSVAADAVAAERRVLLELRPLLSEALRATVPQVVELEKPVEFDGRPAVVFSVVPGIPLTTLYYRWRHTSSVSQVGADFAAMGRWLADLQRVTSGPQAQIDLDGGVIRGLQSRFADDPQLGTDLERLSEAYARLQTDASPRTAVHGDLWFGNILVTGGQVSGVVDWEAGGASGEPVRDLVRFAHMYALYLDRSSKPGQRVAGHPGLRAGGFGAGLEFALTGRGWFPDLFRNFLQDGLSRLGASPANWRDAALAGIAEVAARTDDPQFGQRHLELFRRVSTLVP